MARLAATAVLLLSLLAVASCRVVEAEPETVVAISDEQSQADPSAVPQETDATEALPTVTAVKGILRLPSHRRPCRHGFLHRLRWDRVHGPSHRRGAFAGPGDARVIPAFLPEEPAMEAELEAVAEPDPDSRPDTDDLDEVDEKYTKKPPRGDGDGEENELVKAWKGEMARRFHAHGLRFHHHHHHEHAVEVQKDDSEHQEQQVKEEGAGDTQLQQHVKLFSRHFHHHNHGDDEQQEETAAKHYFHHRHHDSDNEVDEVEDLARRLSKAIMRRSFRRGGNGIRHHHQHHSDSEEGGVKKWFKSIIMNRF